MTTETQPVAQPTIDYNELAKAMFALQQQQAPTPSTFEKAEEVVRKTEDNRVNDEILRQQVKFDLSFDSFIAENQGAFGKFTPASIREACSGLSGSDKVQHMQTVAAKSFFKEKGNMELLSTSDQAYVMNSIMDAHDSKVDGGRAWEMVERAINVSQHQNYADQVRGTGGKTESNLFDAFVSKIKSRFE